MDRQGFTRRLTQAYREKELSEASRGVKFTQRVLADTVHMSQGSIYSYLHGLKVPRPLVIGRLAEALGVTPEWLTYGVEGAMEKPQAHLNRECVGIALRAAIAAPPSLSDEARERFFIEIYSSELTLRQLGVDTPEDSEDASSRPNGDTSA